jgi:gamma-glutamyltranspeptidase/glutathione hydrolase
VERKPVSGEYRGMQVTAAALPSSGGILLLSMLNMLQNFNMAGRSETERAHLLTEVMRRAYRERAEYLGDPDFIKAPVDKLLNPYYAAGLAASIRLDRATPSAIFPGVPLQERGDDTTHFSIMDAAGNRVAATLSINFPFGSGYLVAGTGVLLNNEMDDFSIRPGTPDGYGLIAGPGNPNSILPGKRMLSSMTPTFLHKDGRTAVLGTPGGSRIITMVLLAALKFAEGGSAGDMVALPRFHHQFMPDVLSFEPNAFDRNRKLELQLLGHRLQPLQNPYGNMQVVIWNGKKELFDVASDPRGVGYATVQTPAKPAAAVAK